MDTWSRRWLEKARQRWRDKILGSRKSTVSNTVNCQDRGPPLSYLKKAYRKWARWWCWWKKNYDLIAHFFTIRTGWTRSTEQDTKSSIVQCYRDTPFVWRDNRSLVWSLVRPSVRPSVFWYLYPFSFSFIPSLSDIQTALWSPGWRHIVGYDLSLSSPSHSLWTGSAPATGQANKPIQRLRPKCLLWWERKCSPSSSIHTTSLYLLHSLFYVSLFLSHCSIFLFDFLLLLWLRIV